MVRVVFPFIVNFQSCSFSLAYGEKSQSYLNKIRKMLLSVGFSGFGIGSSGKGCLSGKINVSDNLAIYKVLSCLFVF